MAHVAPLTETVGVFARLKLRLLANQLRGRPWRVVFLVLASLFFASQGVAGAVGAVALRLVDTPTAGVTCVVVGSLAVLGWALIPLLLLSDDDTLDPARFALLPLPPRRLAAGLFVASGIGTAPAATLLVSLATLVTWSRGVGPLALALPSAVLGAATCLVVSRATTAAAAATITGRRGREAVVVITVLAASSLGLVGPVISLVITTVDRSGIEQFVEALAWSPLGAAWAVPWTAAQGREADALARLGIAAATLAVAWLVFERSLERRLRPGRAGRGATGAAATQRHMAAVPARARSLTPGVLALLPEGPLGALAARCLLYWRRDSRYMVSVATVPLLVLLFLAIAASGPGFDFLALGVGPFVAFLLTLTMVNELAFDGTALWTTLAAGVPGRTERAGRWLALAVWAVPATIVVPLAGVWVAGRWDLAPTLVGLSLGVLLTGMAVAAVTSVVWAYPVPEAGSNPFTSASGTSTAQILQQFAAMLALAVLGLPLLFAAVASLWLPDLGWMVLVAGPMYGAAALWGGIVWGGRRFDARGPELLAALRR